MYEKRFGLHRKPFQSVLSEHDYFRSEAFHETSPAILHTLRSDLGIAVLTGPAGIGKSVALEQFRRLLDTDCQTVVIRGGTASHAPDLLHALNRRLNKTANSGERGSRSSSATQRWDVLERLQKVSDFWGPLVILLDDAHLLQADAFSELRALLEEEANGHRVVRLLISGPLSLEEVLAQPAMTDFAQKIRTYAFLQPLRSPEAVNYLRHQITTAGGEFSEIFTSSSIEKIIAAADGVPRSLNLLSDEALIICEESDCNQVSAEIVNQALARLQHLPVAWNETPVSCDSEPSDNFDERSSEQVVVSSESHSVVEFGSSAQASAGVIEIGASDASTVDAVEDASTGVVEIGSETPHLPDPTEATAETEAQTATVEESFDEDIELAEPVDSETPLELADDAGSELTTESAECLDAFSESRDVVDIIANVIQSSSAPGTTPDPDMVAKAVTDFLNSSGLSPATDQAGADSGVSEATDLVHHLLLAAQTDPADTPAELTDVTGSLQLEESVDTADIWSQEEVSWNVCPEEVNLGDYHPWQPAGEWPYEFASAQESAGHDFARNSKASDAPAIDLTEVETIRESVESAAVEETVWSANAKPVFDRYTWCELGRSVSADHVHRMTVCGDELQQATWPPATTGIAPALPIPVSQLDDDYANLLTDLGLLSESLHSEAAQNNEPPLAESHVQQRTNPYQSLPDVPDPELTIDEIQAMLHTEIFEAEGPIPTASDSGASTIDQNSTDGNHEWVGGQLLEDLESETTDESTDPQGNQNDEFRVNVNVEQARSKTHGPSGLSIDFSGLASSFRDERMTGRTTDAADHNSGPNTGDSIAQAAQSQSVVELSDDCELQQAQEEEEEVAYAPRLLQAARSRVINVIGAENGLKKAAGAEMLSIASSLSDSQDQHQVDSAAADTKQPETLQMPGNRRRSRFSDLFTRLRQLNDRSL